MTPRKIALVLGTAAALSAGFGVLPARGGDTDVLFETEPNDSTPQARYWRARRAPAKRQIPYLVHGEGPVLEFAGQSRGLELGGAPLLLRHLVLKCCLNLQSTLVMGRLGLFESNLMTRVKPSNYKLIDRAARHAQHHHRQQTGGDLPYEEAVREVFSRL